MFMKANTKQRRLDFADMVNTALTSGHEFYSFGHPKARSRYTAFRLLVNTSAGAHPWLTRAACGRGIQVKVDMDQTPLLGERSLWRREMCALYRRYTCIDPCVPASQRTGMGFDGFYYNTRSMFMVTARRLR